MAGVRKRTRAVDLGGREAVIVTRRTSYGNVEEEDVEQVEVPKFETDPAHVGVQGSVTRNMGDYNSIRVQVSVDLPCLPVQSEMDRAYDIASGWVRAKIEQELTNAATGSTPDGTVTQEGQAGGTERAEAAGIRRLEV